jgi:hypothetical protein
MALLTVHHWTSVERGLSELRRVARKRVILLTWGPDAERFWLTEEYFPEIRATDLKTFPTTLELTALLERLIGPVSLAPVPIPHDCADGFLCAYRRRPEAYLRADVRSAISSFPKINAEPGQEKLRADLESGRWLERNRDLIDLDALDLGYRIFRCEIEP